VVKCNFITRGKKKELGSRARGGREGNNRFKKKKGEKILAQLLGLWGKGKG